MRRYCDTITPATARARLTVDKGGAEELENHALSLLYGMHAQWNSEHRSPRGCDCSLDEDARGVEVVRERCCGLDVHKKKVVACELTPAGKEILTFGTMTEDLHAMCPWIRQHGCIHVAMESTGVYWKPIENLLEDHGFEILVVNAQQIRQVPGRKTDIKDAEWIVQLRASRRTMLEELIARNTDDVVRVTNSCLWWNPHSVHSSTLWPCGRCTAVRVNGSVPVCCSAVRS